MNPGSIIDPRFNRSEFHQNEPISCLTISMQTVAVRKKYRPALSAWDISKGLSREDSVMRVDG